MEFSAIGRLATAVCVIQALLFWRPIRSAQCCGTCECDSDRIVCNGVTSIPTCDNSPDSSDHLSITFADNPGSKIISKANLNQERFKNLKTLHILGSGDNKCSTGSVVAFDADAFNGTYLNKVATLKLSILCGGNPPARLIQDASFKTGLRQLRMHDDSTIKAIGDNFLEGTTGLQELYASSNSLQSAKFLRQLTSRMETIWVDHNNMLVTIEDLQPAVSTDLRSVRLGGDNMRVECGVRLVLAHVQDKSFPEGCVNITATTTTQEPTTQMKTTAAIGTTTEKAPGSGSYGGDDCKGDGSSSPPSMGDTCETAISQLSKFF